jgi:hypothetical protein
MSFPSGYMRATHTHMSVPLISKRCRSWHSSSGLTTDLPACDWVGRGSRSPSHRASFIPLLIQCANAEMVTANTLTCQLAVGRAEVVNLLLVWFKMKMPSLQL